MFRRFLFLLSVTAFLLMIFSCHETETSHVAVNWWDSLHQAEKDSVVLTPLLNALTAFISTRGIDSSSTSFLIVDDTEENPVILAEFHQNQLLIPASVQKLLVTGAALEILGDKAKKDVTTTNLQSNNHLANKLLQTIGKETYGTYSYSDGIRAVFRFWEQRGIDMSGARMADGSGRRYDNFLTAR
ncbi:MAG: D-alanyl-D-alanine carboxypeptidase, partial [Bacteroidales bacterium]|nr:D-alanyl-D-alanine carboxypeptidase [Bacteroidales bacterium]